VAGQDAAGQSKEQRLGLRVPKRLPTGRAGGEKVAFTDVNLFLALMAQFAAYRKFVPYLLNIGFVYDDAAAWVVL